MKTINLQLAADFACPLNILPHHVKINEGSCIVKKHQIQMKNPLPKSAKPDET